MTTTEHLIKADVKLGSALTLARWLADNEGTIITAQTVREIRDTLETAAKHMEVVSDAHYVCNR